MCSGIFQGTKEAQHSTRDTGKKKGAGVSEERGVGRISAAMLVKDDTK